jgi:hypothetical protein
MCPLNTAAFFTELFAVGIVGRVGVIPTAAIGKGDYIWAVVHGAIRSTRASVIEVSVVLRNLGVVPRKPTDTLV